MDNLADKLQLIATEIYAMQDEQRYTREKQHNYKAGLFSIHSSLVDLKKLKNKVILSSVFETVMMLLCCLLQFVQYRNMIKL